jgi:hypothetical protein
MLGSPSRLPGANEEQSENETEATSRPIRPLDKRFDFVSSKYPPTSTCTTSSSAPLVSYSPTPVFSLVVLVLTIAEREVVVEAHLLVNLVEHVVDVLVAHQLAQLIEVARLKRDHFCAC